MVVTVLFLPSKLGAAETVLTVHTSLGDLRVACVGEAIENMFRLAPLTDIVLPIETRLTPSITFHNPYNRPFHIKEIYTTENFLHLVLPPKTTDDTKLWHLEPLQTKEVIKLSFEFQEVGVYRGFIHLKTEADQTFVVPVEIKVVAGGLMFICLCLCSRLLAIF